MCCRNCLFLDIFATAYSSNYNIIIYVPLIHVQCMLINDRLLKYM